MPPRYERRAAAVLNKSDAVRLIVAFAALGGGRVVSWLRRVSITPRRRCCDDLAHPGRRRRHRRTGRGQGPAGRRLPARRGRGAARHHGPRRRHLPARQRVPRAAPARPRRAAAPARRPDLPAGLPGRPAAASCSSWTSPRSGPASASPGRCPAPTCSRCCSPAVGGEVRYDTEVRDLEIVDGTAKVEFADGPSRSTTWSSAPTAGARRSGPRPASAVRRSPPARSSTAAWSAAARRQRLDRPARPPVASSW